MQIENQSGCSEKFFNEQQLSFFTKLFLSKSLIDTGGNVKGSKTIGVHEDAPLYPIVEKEFMIPLRKHFDQDLKLVFAMYCDCKHPFDIHDDCSEHIDRKLPGKPWISCLVPLSVDNDESKTNLATTVIFNETDYTVPKENNCESMFESKFTHVTRSRLKALTLQEEYIWNRGDLVWWYSPLNHVSTHFDKFASKQMLVAHTYIV